MHCSRAFLFDLDGVLLDSEGLYTAFWEETERIFPTGVANFAHVIKGTNLESILSYFDEGTRPKVLQRIHNFDSNLTYRLFPDAENLLDAIKLRGMSIALVTSSNSEKMSRLFSLYPGLEARFDVIINGSMVSRSKPDPEGYLRATEAVGVSPEQCVVVEDSLQGIHAGRAAGATVWALATTLPRTIVEPEAHKTFENLSELLNFFNREGV